MNQPKSGISAAKFLSKDYDVYLTEYKKDVDLEQVKELENLGIKVEYGSHSDKFIEGASFVVTSPGIPPKSDIFKRIKERDIPVISEIELAYQSTDAPFVVITGTNGKTTTTSLVSHILNEDFTAPVCGNIGVPPTSLIEDENDFLVCEVSSFKAEFVILIAPR